MEFLFRFYFWNEIYVAEAGPELSDSSDTLLAPLPLTRISNVLELQVCITTPGR